MSSRYHYTPLTSDRSIRVFTLFPSRDINAPIQGQLAEVDLDVRPSYEALSYLCGQKEHGFEVNIVASNSGGLEEGSVVPVTPNCISALRILRDQSKPRTLWVDAICIDQAPSSEKSQQVALMTEIFKSAETVLIWLNPGDQTASQVGRVARLISIVGWLYKFRLLRVYERDEQTDSRMPPESRAVVFWDKFVASGSIWLGDSLNAPFLNRYFNRVWTVQEIAMARKVLVHYGQEKIQWRDFVAFALFTVKQGGFARNQEASIDVFRDYETHWNLINSLESHFVLPDIYGVEALYNDSDVRDTLSRYTPGTAELALIKSKGLEAFEPKDKAYAMLWNFLDSSVASKQLRKVDYEKPLELVYTEFTTAAFFKSNGSTNLLYLVNSLPRLVSLPSWVPDWSQTNSMSYFLWTSQLRKYRAAKEESSRYRIALEGPLLRISGVEYCGMRALVRFSADLRQVNFKEAAVGDLAEALIDTAYLVKGLIDTAKQLAGPGHDDDILQAAYRAFHSQKAVYDGGPDDQMEPSAQPKEQMLSERLGISVGVLRVHVLDKLSFLIEEDTADQALVEARISEYLLPDEIEILHQDIAEYSHLAPFLAVVVALSRYIDLYHFLHIILLDHRDKDLFITDKGNIGMSFQGMQKDDLVVVWQGCPSPFVVRIRPDADEARYELHGPAYVDGIMMGEAWIIDEGQLREFEVAQGVVLTCSGRSRRGGRKANWNIT